jgi:hypothetical protein
LALGLGFISLAVLGLGLIGWLNQAWAVGIVAAGDLIAISVLYFHGRKWDAEKWLKGPPGWAWLWVAIAAVMGVVVLAAFFPPGLLWGDEPNGYDVVEYHLQVPRQWYEAGRIVPLHENVFSFMPFNVEMHYLLAMHLHGGPWAGMYLAQLMHVGMCAAAVWAVYALVGGGRRGTVAAILVAAIPWTGLLAPVAYNEGGTLLFGSLAIGWAIRASSWRGFLIAGLMAGFAAGTKLSVAPLILLAVPISILVLRRKYFAGCAVYLLASLLVLSPWLIRNWKWCGNPVFPEAMNVLGKAHFSDVQVERWRQAYLPDKNHRSATGRIEEMWNQVIADWRYGFVLLPLGAAAFVLCREKKEAIYLGILLVSQLIFWLCFTHLQSRFMVMEIPIIALLIAQFESEIWIRTIAVLAVAMAIFSCGMLIDKLGRYLDADRQVALIGRENLEGLRMFDMRQLREDQSLDLVGDACAFLYQIPMSRLHYKTVFDVDTADPNESIEQAWLAGMPADAVIWRDEPELERFAKTYYRMKK